MDFGFWIEELIPVSELNRRRATGVSDNESWVDTKRTWNRGTETVRQWNEFNLRNRDAKLVCIDIQPNAHTQAQERRDILNVGGFSDQVFTLVSEFANGNLDGTGSLRSKRSGFEGDWTSGIRACGPVRDRWRMLVGVHGQIPEKVRLQISATLPERISHHACRHSDLKGRMPI